MILVWEPQCVGSAHEAVNAGILASIQLANPGLKVVFISEQTHGQHVQDLLVARGHPVPILQPLATGEADRILPVFTTFLRFLWLLKNKFRQTKFSGLVITTGHSLNLALLILLHRVLGIAGEVLVVWHSQINALKPQAGRKFYEITLPLMLAKSDKSPFTHLVMNEKAVPAIHRRINVASTRFQFTHHPNVFPAIPPPLESPRNGRTAVFASVGRGKPKNFRTLEHLLEELDVLDDMALWSIGGSNRRLMQGESMVRTFGEERRLARDKIDALCRKADFFIFLYGQKDHELSASGAFFDAVGACRPIIFLENPFLDYYFERYSFGIRCSTLEELATVVGNIAKGNHSYPLQLFREEILRLRNDTDARHCFHSFKV